MANHLGLDFDLVELLTGVDTDDAADHLGDNDHVTEVGLDEVGLLVGASLLLGLAELLDETHGLALQTAVEATTSAGVNDITELFGGEVEEPVQINRSDFHSISFLSGSFDSVIMCRPSTVDSHEDIPQISRNVHIADIARSESRPSDRSAVWV